MIHIRLALGLLVPLVASAALPAHAQESHAPFCAIGQDPRFSAGFAALYDELKIARMGSPTECEHADAGTGDTLQRTDRGLAFYRQSTNTPTFTNGFDHWALTANGLVSWNGDSIDPPVDAPSPPPPPGQEIADRARYGQLLQSSELAWLDTETAIDEGARRLRLRIVDPVYGQQLADLLRGVAERTTGLIRAATPPEDLQTVHAIYLAAADEYEAGVATAITGLPNNDQNALAIAHDHFLRSRALAARARVLLG